MARPKPAPELPHPALVDEGSVPLVCLVNDMCRLLRMSRQQFYMLRRAGKIPIPELEPKLDTHPRFSGRDVVRYLEGEYRPRPPLRHRNGHRR